MKTITQVRANGKNWRILTPIPARCKLIATMRIARLDRECPTVSMFGGIIRFWAGGLCVSQFVPAF